MAQLRQDHDQFIQRNAEVVIVGPDGPRAFKRYWESKNMPPIGLADIGSKVADQYDQEVNLIKLGRMPALFIVDLEGVIRFKHYGSSISDIPTNDLVLQVLDQIIKEDSIEIEKR